MRNLTNQAMVAAFVAAYAAQAPDENELCVKAAEWFDEMPSVEVIQTVQAILAAAENLPDEWDEMISLIGM